MTNPTSATQVAAVDVLLDDDAFVGLSGSSPDGPAVYAQGQSYDDVWPRTTLGPPQRVSRGGSCGQSADMILTLHHWAKGDDATLIAADLADAAVRVLRRGLSVPGWRVSSWCHLSARPVGDPDPTVEHIVSEFRFSIHGSD